MLIAGMPDEEVPAGQNGVFSSKAIIVGAAAIALFVGAITARAAMIIGGCLLFIVDFVLLLAWDSMLHDQPANSLSEGESAHPSEIVLTVLVLWVVFPVLTMLIAIVWSAGRSKAGLIGQSPSRLEGMVANARLDQNMKAGSGVADAPRNQLEPPWW
ncbi:hypothetical protein [Nocardia bhagyanarayanae]|nr:hypothetical protein [Nocardia bhagyanarayanae]